MKCPNCDGPLEILVPAMIFEDPVICKCVRCRSTVVFPGTITMTTEGKLVNAVSHYEPIINLGVASLEFTGVVDDSLGLYYDVVYPEDDFILYYDELQGGVIKYILTPLRTGLFCVTEIIYCRGKLDTSMSHYYLVE